MNFFRMGCLGLAMMGLSAMEARAQVYLPLTPAVVPVGPAVSVYSSHRPVLTPVAPVYSATPAYSSGYGYSAGYGGIGIASTYPTYSAGYGGYDAYSPVRSYSAGAFAAPVVAPLTPVVAYPAAVVRPKVYVPGQPVRNIIEAITP